MSLCLFQSTALPSGRWQHVCPDCGRTYGAATASLRATCRGKGAVAVAAVKPAPLTPEARQDTVDKMAESIAAMDPEAVELARPRLKICEACEYLKAGGCKKVGGCHDCWVKWRARLVDPAGKSPAGKW